MENKKRVILEFDEGNKLFQCEWCGKKFSTKIILKTHVQTAKYCLKQRGENSPNINVVKCDFCFSIFNTKLGLTRHMKICRKRKEIDSDLEKRETEKLHNLEIKKLEKKVKVLKSTVKEQENYIKEIELKLAKGEGVIETFKESKPQQNNITNYVKNNKIKNVLTTTIPPLTIKLVRENVRNNYTYDLFCKGEAGLLTFIEGIITKKSEEDEDLIEKNYACTDVTRNNCHMLTRKDPNDWKIDAGSSFINKILDELVEPVEEHYQKLLTKIDNTPHKIPRISREYVFDSSLSMDKNLEKESEFNKNVVSMQQQSEQQLGYNMILEEIEPIYYGITSEDKREELFKSIRNKVKNVASI